MYMYNHYGGPKHHFEHTRFLQPLVLLSCCRAIIPMLVQKWCLLLLVSNHISFSRLF